MKTTALQVQLFKAHVSLACSWLLGPLLYKFLQNNLYDLNFNVCESRCLSNKTNQMHGQHHQAAVSVGAHPIQSHNLAQQLGAQGGGTAT